MWTPEDRALVGDYGSGQRLTDDQWWPMQQAEDRADLRRLLDRRSGGVIFTTLQKFAPDPGETVYLPLTERRNVIVMADEAQRSQYGLRAKINKAGDVSYGFAKYLRGGLPGASFIGFTGTLIESQDARSRAPMW